MVLFLAAITFRLCRRVLGADDAPFRSVMGKRGEADAAAGPVTTGTGTSSRGATTVAASAAKPPCESGQGAGRGIAEGAQCCQQHREEDVNPLDIIANN